MTMQLPRIHHWRPRCPIAVTESHHSRHLPFLILVGILAADVVAAAATAQQPPVPAPATKEQGDADVPSASIPMVGEFFILPDPDGTHLRVRFAQDKGTLTATWMTADGVTYGVGSYSWDAATRSFNGSATTPRPCPSPDGHQTAMRVLVREELHFLNDRELLNRWTKPMSMDCVYGVVDVFKWEERLWIATDKDWKPVEGRSNRPKSAQSAPG